MVSSRGQRTAVEPEPEPDVRMRFSSPGPGRIPATRRVTSLARLKYLIRNHLSERWISAPFKENRPGLGAISGCLEDLDAKAAGSFFIIRVPFPAFTPTSEARLQEPIYDLSISIWLVK